MCVFTRVEYERAKGDIDDFTEKIVFIKKIKIHGRRLEIRFTHKIRENRFHEKLNWKLISREFFEGEKQKFFSLNKNSREINLRYETNETVAFTEIYL